MSDIARAFMIGRLTHDMEYRADGRIGALSIAVNRYAGPEKGEQVSFFDCSLFGKAVQGVGPYLKKGRQVAVEAEPVQRSWRDTLTGQKKTTISFNIRNIQLLDHRPEEELVESEPAGESAPEFDDGRPRRDAAAGNTAAHGAAQEPEPEGYEYIDDLPF